MRTPLAILRTRIDTTLEPLAAKELQADIDGVVRILDQLLELAELEATSTSGWGDADLRDLCASVVALTAPFAIAEGKSVEFSSADGRLIVWCNADMMTRALRNLVENAIRFSPSGGAVEVELAAPDIILVKDRGPGNPAAGPRNDFPPLLEKRPPGQEPFRSWPGHRGQNRANPRRRDCRQGQAWRWHYLRTTGHRRRRR